MLTSLVVNIKEALFPEKLPPLRLSSRPVAVREIWTTRRHKKATSGSLTLHALAIASLIAISIWGGRAAKVVTQQDNVTLIAPPLSDYQPVMKPAEAPKVLAGGGGGGNAAKIYESKGHLPKVAPEQIAPPTVEILNTKPKLAVEATVVAPPHVKLPDNPTMPNIGNPMSTRVTGPASNGGHRWRYWLRRQQRRRQRYRPGTRSWSGRRIRRRDLQARRYRRDCAGRQVHS
jgi:hypothetical protein